jgi:hypothetical protein
MPVDEEEIVKGLESLPQEDPPPDLRTSIMTAVQAQRPVARPIPFLRGRRKVIFAAGWVMAAAIVLIFLTMVVMPANENPYATMAPVPTEYASDEVTVSVWREADLVKIEPKLVGDQPVSITVRWDPNSAAFAGIYGVLGASSQNNQTTFTLSHPSQRSVVSLGVHPAAGAADVVVLVDEVEVVRAEVPLN